jgi:hypothetical protein
MKPPCRPQILDQLAYRLRRRGFALRDADVARAARMHRHVDKSSGLITARDFEHAFGTLARAGVENDRLRDVVGR